MTAAPAGGGLAEVLALVQREFDMPIRWSENGNIVPEIYSQDCEIAAVYSERDDDKCPRKAEAIIAAVNYLRSHGEAVAELIEAARKAHIHIASIGHPADASGRYDKDGEWTFAEAVPQEVNAAEIKAAFLTLDAALAKVASNGDTK